MCKMLKTHLSTPALNVFNLKYSGLAPFYVKFLTFSTDFSTKHYQPSILQLVIEFACQEKIYAQNKQKSTANFLNRI